MRGINYGVEMMKLEIGKTYLITAQRKGTFMMRVTKQDDTWTEGVVMGGKASEMLDYNVKSACEELTCRTSFIQRATEQPSAA